MSEPSEGHFEYRLYSIEESFLVKLLERAHAGEDVNGIMFELWANAPHEVVNGDEMD